MGMLFQMLQEFRTKMMIMDALMKLLHRCHEEERDENTMYFNSSMLLLDRCPIGLDSLAGCW